MPVGAVIGGAVIAGGATIGAGALAADAQSDAAHQAADTSYATAQLNNDLFREIYGQNTALASPFYNNGLLAGNALTDLLMGTHSFNPAIVKNPTVPGGGTFPQFPGSPNGGPAEKPPYTAAQIAAMRNDGIPKNAAQAQAALDAWNASHSAGSGALAGYAPTGGTQQSAPVAAPVDRPLRSDFRGDPTGYRGALADYRTSQGGGTTPTPTPAAGGVTATPTAQSAWDAFRNSTNYKFRLGEGQNALESAWAANGAFDSGAEKKAAIKFNQNFAANELSNYMNLLASQQAAGLSAAGAVMGVGTSYAGNVAAQNTAAANAAANAALAGGAGQAGMYGAIGQGVGQIGGALFQYGMRPPQYPTSSTGASGINVTPTSQSNYWQNWQGF